MATLEAISGHFSASRVVLGQTIYKKGGWGCPQYASLALAHAPPRGAACTRARAIPLQQPPARLARHARRHKVRLPVSARHASGLPCTRAPRSVHVAGGPRQRSVGRASSLVLLKIGAYLDRSDREEK